MAYDDSTMPRNVSYITVIISVNKTQLKRTTLESLVADEKCAFFEFVTCFIVENSSPVRYHTLLSSYRSFVGLFVSLFRVVAQGEGMDLKMETARSPKRR
jgi:hypothetical protein